MTGFIEDTFFFYFAPFSCDRCDIEMSFTICVWYFQFDFLSMHVDRGWEKVKKCKSLRVVENESITVVSCLKSVISFNSRKIEWLTLLFRRRAAIEQNPKQQKCTHWSNHFLSSLICFWNRIFFQFPGLTFWQQGPRMPFLKTNFNFSNLTLNFSE